MLFFQGKIIDIILKEKFLIYYKKKNSFIILINLWNFFWKLKIKISPNVSMIIPLIMIYFFKITCPFIGIMKALQLILIFLKFS